MRDAALASVAYVTDAFVLPDDVRFLDVSEIDDVTLELPHGHVVLRRSSVTAMSGLVTAEVATLLRRFKQPSTIVNAVVNFSQERSLIADEVLVETYPALRNCIAEGFLVAADSSIEAAVLRRFARVSSELAIELLPVGERVGPYEVVRCVSVSNETEVYQALAPSGSRVALKMVRFGASPSALRSLQRELELLPVLPQPPTVALVGAGDHEGRGYVALDWIDSVPWPAPLHVDSDASHRNALTATCADIVGIFARLHRLGVVHGDVHPGNLLFDVSGRPRIIDFGRARRLSDTDSEHSRSESGRSLNYRAPECVDGGITERAEQFSVAALIFELMTGTDPLTLDGTTQLAHPPMSSVRPRSFASIGLRSWPAVEAVLQRALRHDPAQRYADIQQFELALRQLLASRRVAGPPQLGRPDERLTQLVRDTYGSCSSVSLPIRSHPQSSVFFGVAGLASALVQIGRAHNDSETIRAAELWLARGRRQSESDGAWTSEEHGITHDTVGSLTPYHREAGLAVVDAQISRALGDIGGVMHAVDEFVDLHSDHRLTNEGTRVPELVRGLSGSLLVAAGLRTIAVGSGVDSVELDVLGDRMTWMVLEHLNGYRPVGDEPAMPSLGVADGWGGVLLALVRWSESSQFLLPPQVRERLAQLSSWADSAGSALLWPWTPSHHDATTKPSPMTGWCRGNAGFAALYLSAARVYGDVELLDVAERSALPLLSTPGELGSLCCGAAGGVHALASLGRFSGDVRYSNGARRLALVGAAHEIARIESARPVTVSPSLFAGPVGLANAISTLQLGEVDCPWLGIG